MTASSKAPQEALVAEYRACLRRHYWRRIVPTLIGSGAVVGFCVSDLHRFSTTGTSLLHPFLAVFFALAGAALALVAIVAARTVSRYTSPFGDQP